MAGVTGRGEARLFVTRIRGAVVFIHVTGSAGSTRQLVLSIDVALGARQAHVGSGQGKTRTGVVEAGITPRSRAVTRLAGLREVGLYMVGSGSVLEILQMA